MEGFYGRRGRREARSYGSVAAEVRGLQLSGLHAANPYKQSLSLIQWLVNCNGDSILSSKIQKELYLVWNFLQNSGPYCEGTSASLENWNQLAFIEPWQS